ncbi:MAG: hypothetical protein ABJK37_18680 [Paraglaciecola sp.]|uniref:hypothetical protein n=1 Tax=Paraglaciecola sp. TaxID=1920173 RepID=UPI0032992B16
MITKQTFHYLYVNANCLTELALRSLPADLDSLLDDLQPIDDTELANELELDTNLEDLNFAAMEGLDFYDSDVESPIIEPEAPTVELSRDAEPQAADPQEEFNIETYMANVYGLEDQLAERIEAAYAQIDHNEFKSLLNLLPAELPAIDKKLTGEEMTLWQQQYANDVEAINNLLIAIRQLDFT